MNTTSPVTSSKLDSLIFTFSPILVSRALSEVPIIAMYDTKLLTILPFSLLFSIKAPVFASITAITAYFFVKEITGRSDSGLLTALLIAIVPGYISRSVAGSYDNEAVAITA